MHYGQGLHQALTQVLFCLDKEALQPSLDQAVADIKSEDSIFDLSADILDRIGLSFEEIPFDAVDTQHFGDLVILGVSNSRCVVIQEKKILEWTSIGRHKKIEFSKLAEYQEMTWMVVRSGSALDSLANPGGEVGAWERLFRFIRLEKQDISAVAIYSATLGALSLVTPIATQALVNTIAFGAVLQPLIILIIVLFIGLSLAATLKILQAYLVEVFQRRIIVNVAEDLGARLPKVAEQAEDRLNLIELNNRFLDVITVQKSAAELLLTGLALILQTGVGFILLALYHPILLGFSFMVILGLVLVTFLGRGGTESAIIESKAKFSLAAWLDELARNPRRFRGGHGRILAAQELAQRAQTYVKARRYHFRRVFALIIGGNVLQVLVLVGLLAIGGWLVIERQLTLGQLVAAELVVSGIAFGIGKFGKLADKTFDLVAALDKIGRLLDLPLVPLGKDLIEEGGGGLSVEAQNLKVAYGNDNPLNIKVSFSLVSGEKALINGNSNSGQSALLEAIAGWREVKGGILRWNGHVTLNSDTSAEAIWMMRKDELVSGSLMTNLRMANASLSTEEARNVLKKVGLRKVIDRLSNGWDTHLLPNGAPLSPSEVKRLMVAQVLIAQPRLLVIDEVLDGLEEEYSDLIEALIGKQAPWTAVVTSRHARICEMLPKHLNVEYFNNVS